MTTGGPQLTVRYSYGRRPRIDLTPGAEPLHLDRQFLNPSDLTVSRRPDAPVLLFRAGEWWLDNNCSRVQVPTIFTPSLDRRVDIPYGCSFRLREGGNELHLWKADYVLTLTVTGASTPVAGGAGAGPGPQTVYGSPEADQRLRTLFQRSPRYKQIMAALYREYLTAGIDRPKELPRQYAADCVGGDAHEVSDAKKAVMTAIWGKQGHGDDIAAYLINRRFLTSRDQTLVPHRRCSHRPPIRRP